MVATADVLVIGGGIAGISAGARLAPDVRVIVLEAEPAPGYHSTGRSAATYIRNYGNATVRALNAAGADEFHSPGELADGPLLRRRGLMVLATEGEEALLDATMSGAEGLNEIEPDEAVSRFPILRRAPIRRAALEADASDIDVDRLLQGFLRQLRRHSGALITNARAQGITRRGDSWSVETPAGTFKASVLINAAGAWADPVASMANVPPLGVQPMRRSAAILPPPDGHDVTDWPLVVSASETWYARPEVGNLLVSPADEDPVDAHDVWPDDMVLAEGLDRFERATTMPVTRVERSWAGLRSFAPDRTPIAGFDPDDAGFFWLAGQGGYGIQTAPALSRLAADLVLGRRPALEPDVVSALAPDRLRTQPNHP